MTLHSLIGMVLVQMVQLELLSNCYVLPAFLAKTLRSPVSISGPTWEAKCYTSVKTLMEVVPASILVPRILPILRLELLPLFPLRKFSLSSFSLPRLSRMALTHRLAHMHTPPCRERSPQAWESQKAFPSPLIPHHTIPELLLTALSWDRYTLFSRCLIFTGLLRNVMTYPTL